MCVMNRQGLVGVSCGRGVRGMVGEFVHNNYKRFRKNFGGWNLEKEESWNICWSKKKICCGQRDLCSQFVNCE